TRFPRARRCVESPDFLSGERIMRCDVAIIAIAGTCAAGDDLSFDDNRSGCVATRVGFRFPSNLARARVEAYDIAVRSGIQNDVFINRKRLRTALCGYIGWSLAFVLPNEI